MVSKFLIRMDYVYLSRYEFQNYIHICICIYDCYIFYAHFHCSIFILIEKTHTRYTNRMCSTYVCYADQQTSFAECQYYIYMIL